MKTALAVAALLLPLLSGCISDSDQGAVDEGADEPLPPLKRSLHALAEVRPFEAEMDDGAYLRGHVYIPSGEGPFPIVLDASPYFDTGEWRSGDQVVTAEDGRQTMTYIWRDLMDAGFAVALISVRGSGTSEGCFTFASERSWTDMHDLIEALAAQEWSNGNVGMLGISYDAWTQYMAISSAPPSLKATVPMSSVLDYWSLITRQGAPIWYNGATLSTEWTVKASTGTYGMGVLLAVLGYNAGPTDVIPEPPHPSHFNCPDDWLADAQTNLALIHEGDDGPYFQERSYHDQINATSVPMLVTNGLTSGEGHILQVEGLWPLLPEGDRRMILGQWGHDIPNGKYEGWSDLLVGWFDHYLADGPRTFEVDLVDYEDTEGQWHQSSSWPPASNTTTLNLGGGTLSFDDPTPSEQTFRWLRGDPSLTRCGPFQAAYVSPPLAEDIFMAGNFEVAFTLTTDRPDGNVAAFLYHTPGTASCPDFDGSEVRRALADLRHVDGRAGQPFPTGSPTPISLSSQPFATNVPAGDRLVLLVGSESDEIMPDGSMPTYTVTTGPDQKGAVHLPVVSGTLRFQ